MNYIQRKGVEKVLRNCLGMKEALIDIRNSEIIDDEERHELGIMLFGITKIEYIIRGLLEVTGTYTDEVHNVFISCQHSLAGIKRSYLIKGEVV